MAERYGTVVVPVYKPRVPGARQPSLYVGPLRGGQSSLVQLQEEFPVVLGSVTDSVAVDNGS